jgi:hypothetical protein
VEVTYRHQPWRVHAIQWTEDNFEQVAQFVRDYIGPDEDTGIRNEPDGGYPDEPYTYNIVEFTTFGRGHQADVEVDPGEWIVVRDVPDAPAFRKVRTMDDDEFRRTYEPAPDQP